MSKVPLIVWAILLLVFVSMGCVSQAEEKRFEKKFPATPGGTLTLDTDLGSLAITGTTANEVSVVAEMKGKQRDIDDFNITANETKDGVEVKGTLKKKLLGIFRSSSLDVRFTVQVPQQYNLVLRTSGGSIGVATISGTVKGRTSGGSVSIRHVEGDAEMTTSGGSVNAEQGKGRLLMHTSGGSIGVTAQIGDIDVHTSGGSISLTDVDGRIQASTSGGGVRVTLAGSNKGIHVESSGGNVDIVLPKDVDADLDLETSGGHVQSDIPVTVKGKMEESELRGTVNGGGNLIWAHTSGGNVSVRAKE